MQTIIFINVGWQQKFALVIYPIAHQFMNIHTITIQMSSNWKDTLVDITGKYFWWETISRIYTHFFCQLFRLFIKRRWVKALYLKCLILIIFQKRAFSSIQIFLKTDREAGKKGMFTVLKMLCLKKIYLYRDFVPKMVRRRSRIRFDENVSKLPFKTVFFGIRVQNLNWRPFTGKFKIW